MPAMDEGGFILDYHTAPGTSLTETDRLLRQVEAILRDDPGGADLFAANRRFNSAAGSQKPIRATSSSG